MRVFYLVRVRVVDNGPLFLIAVIPVVPGDLTQVLAFYDYVYGMRSGITASRPRAVPPLGPVGIPPVKPVRRVRPPLIAGRTYTHERAGITLPILPGFVGRIQAGVFVMVRRSRLPATGTALVSELLVTPAGLEQLFGQFASGFAQASAGEDELEYEATAEYPTPLGRAVARSWSLSDSDGMLRVVVLPVCSKTGSLVFSQLWWDELGRTQLEEWLRQLQPIRAGPPPICAELDP